LSPKVAVFPDICQGSKSQVNRNLNINQILTSGFSILKVLEINLSWFPLKFMMATKLIVMRM